MRPSYMIEVKRINRFANEVEVIRVIEMNPHSRGATPRNGQGGRSNQFASSVKLHGILNICKMTGWPVCSAAETIDSAFSKWIVECSSPL